MVNLIFIKIRVLYLHKAQNQQRLGFNNIESDVILLVTAHVRITHKVQLIGVRSSIRGSELQPVGGCLLLLLNPLNRSQTENPLDHKGPK
jgi:hypothetical protein